MAKYSIHLEDRSGYGGDILGERMSSSVVIDDLSSLVLVCLQGSVYCSIVLNLTLFADADTPVSIFAPFV